MLGFNRYTYKLCLSNTICINYLTNYNIKNLSLSNNQLAIVNTLKDLIAIKSGEQYINQYTLSAY